jgi:hypothetical protein
MINWELVIALLWIVLAATCIDWRLTKKTLNRR